ncbi:hypothetical protein GUJ93_ZPchr0013g37443 [Zizania palustris]|uniref:Uncharacterized protein n=1 Tax=Zizania palustris TaxID=103762 RepID=A0A8J5WWF9_ZIZPA|nr:hypothetical protein GUJ93_ZPchr0013g37443 [Zizania palustris]
MKTGCGVPPATEHNPRLASHVRLTMHNRGRPGVLTLAPRVVAPPLTGGRDRSAARRRALRLRVAFTAAGKLDGAPLPSGERVDSGQLAGGRCSAVAVAGRRRRAAAARSRRRALAPPRAALRAPPLALGPGGGEMKLGFQPGGSCLLNGRQSRSAVGSDPTASSDWVPNEPRREAVSRPRPRFKTISHLKEYSHLTVNPKTTNDTTVVPL